MSRGTAPPRDTMIATHVRGPASSSCFLFAIISIAINIIVITIFAIITIVTSTTKFCYYHEYCYPYYHSVISDATIIAISMIIVISTTVTSRVTYGGCELPDSFRDFRRLQQMFTGFCSLGFGLRDSEASRGGMKLGRLGFRVYGSGLRVQGLGFRDYPTYFHPTLGKISGQTPPMAKDSQLNSSGMISSMNIRIFKLILVLALVLVLVLLLVLVLVS